MPGCFRRPASRNTLVLVLAALLAAAVLTAPAAAHVDASPAFLAAGTNETIALAAHNDRDVTMNEITVRVPAGLTITDVLDIEGWESSHDDRVATWTGGHLAGDTGQTFSIDLAAPDSPGPATLEIEQRYPDGGVVRSPVALTVLPADESEDATLRVLVLVLVGLLLVAAGVWIVVARRRAAVR
jgi:uncharacterized protein YcnI